MPRYLFNLHERGDVITDFEGRELPTENEARLCAMRDARHIMAHDVLAGRLNLTARIQVVNHDTGEAFDLTFRDTVSITGPGLSDSGAG